MGFFKNMFDEAGRKTGKAIGNKLFPKSTDYIRIGDLGDDRKEQLEMELEAQQDRLKMEHQNGLMQSLLQIHFDTKDIDNNIEGLTKVAAILDSLPSRLERDQMDNKVYKMAKSMMSSGIAICKSINPNNAIVKHFESKY